MDSRKWFKIIVVVGILLFFGLVIADSLGVFNPKPYTEVPHGSHVHYVPHDRDPDVPLNAFPMTAPGPGETITPRGEIVPESAVEQ